MHHHSACPSTIAHYLSCIAHPPSHSITPTLLTHHRRASLPHCSPTIAQHHSHIAHPPSHSITPTLLTHHRTASLPHCSPTIAQHHSHIAHPPSPTLLTHHHSIANADWRVISCGDGKMGYLCETRKSCKSPPHSIAHPSSHSIAHSPSHCITHPPSYPAPSKTFTQHPLPTIT